MRGKKDNRTSVYVAMLYGKVIYVGKGVEDRWKHCISGTSSCRYLNYLHFQGEPVTVHIVCEGLSDFCASTVEQALIYRYDPEGNTHRTDWRIEDVQDELTSKGIDFNNLLRLEAGFTFRDGIVERFPPANSFDEQGKCATKKRHFPCQHPFVSDDEFISPSNPIPKRKRIRYIVPDDACLSSSASMSA